MDNPIIHTFLVEEQRLYLEGLCVLMEADDDIACVGTATSAMDLAEEVKATPADVIVVSFPLHTVDGLALLGQLQADPATRRVLALTSHETVEYARQLLAAGAMGIIGKRDDASELLRAIREVAASRQYLPWWLESDGGAAAPPERGEPPPRLSRREREVLALVAGGHTNQETADRLGVSVKTVEGYRARLMRKLDVKNRAELVQAALRYGLLSVDDGGG